MNRVPYPMRKAMHCWRKIGLYNSIKNFSAGPNYVGVESPFSGPPSQGWKMLSVKTALTAVFGVAAVSYCREWVTFNGSNMYENWKGQRKMQELQKKLDREKHGSSEAFLEMVDREIKALKPELSKRRTRDCEVKLYEREVAVLKSEVSKWGQKDTKESQMSKAA